MWGRLVRAPGNLRNRLVRYEMHEPKDGRATGAILLWDAEGKSVFTEPMEFRTKHIVPLPESAVASLREAGIATLLVLERVPSYQRRIGHAAAAALSNLVEAAADLGAPLSQKEILASTTSDELLLRIGEKIQLSVASLGAAKPYEVRALLFHWTELSQLLVHLTHLESDLLAEQPARPAI